MHVSFTISTVPLLLLAWYLWHRAKHQLLPVAMFLSIFQASSVLNIALGGAEFGITPCYFVLLIALGQKIFKRAKQREFIPGPLNSTSILLILFTIYSTITALTNPWIFKGVPINNPKFAYELIPLEFRAGCLNQLAYLLILVSLYFTSAYKTTQAEVEKAFNWYVGGAVLAACFSFYQFLCLKTGLPYPNDFLHSNPGIAYFEGYEIAGFPRMNSTFSEASAAGEGFLGALTLILWRIMAGSISLRNIVFACAIFLGLLLTISTSAYLCLGYVALVAALTYLRPIKGTVNARASKILLTVPVFGVVLISLLNPTIQDSVTTLVRTIILEKKDSSSYKERSQWNEDTISTAAQTNWLGAGYGVCRASSLIPTMLGNVGIPGVVIFGLMQLQLFLPIFKRNGVRSPVHGAILFTLSTIFLDLVIAGPDMAVPIIWLLTAEASRFAALKPRRPLRIIPLGPPRAKLLVKPRSRLIGSLNASLLTPEPHVP